MFRFPRKADPDVVCFQEYFYEETDYFETTDTLGGNSGCGQRTF